MLKCTEKALRNEESILNLEQAATQIIRNMGIPANTYTSERQLYVQWNSRN